jgi:hypothetical protein
VDPAEAERLSDREFPERVRLHASLIVTDDYEAARQAGSSLVHNAPGRAKEVLEDAGVTLAGAQRTWTVAASWHW